MRFFTGLGVVLFALVLPSPAAAANPRAAIELAEGIEEAQGRDAWIGKEVLVTDLEVSFGGRTVIAGQMLMTPEMHGVRIVGSDGTTLVWDGTGAWMAPADAGLSNPRFHVLTWAYFLAAPFKLQDPGAHLEYLGERPFRGGETLPAARLTFDEGVGDSPDDWYVVYRDPVSGRLAGMAYIVTFGPTTVEEAEAEPHLVVYREPVEIGGVTLATAWDFYHWNSEEGGHGEPIGRVTLRNPRFLAERPNDVFVEPENARPLGIPE